MHKVLCVSFALVALAAMQASAGEIPDIRKILNKFNNGPLDMIVAHAIVIGILYKSQVPPKLLEYLSTTPRNKVPI